MLTIEAAKTYVAAKHAEWGQTVGELFADDYVQDGVHLIDVKGHQGTAGRIHWTVWVEDLQDGSPPFLYGEY